eukprot:m.150135 g.150135  ORF g.150135 m.150135 type:complete len:1342 (-) comp16308_c0_seq2:50-4075(-)
MMSEASSPSNDRGSASPSPTRAVRERRIKEQKDATDVLRALNSNPMSPSSHFNSPISSARSSPAISRRHSLIDLDRQLSVPRSRSSSSRSHAPESAARHSQMDQDMVRVRNESHIHALQAELHAVKVQLEAKTTLASEQAVSNRDLELRYASKHREAKELAATVESLEQQVCRDKAELNKLRQDKQGGNGSRGKRDEDLINLLHGATKELQNKRNHIIELTSDRDVLKTQLSAVEQIFLQAMAASGIHDVVTGEHGIDCMTALMDEYRLQRDEIQSLQQLLAESRAQIQGSQTQVLKLQDMLNMIEVSTMDVEAENKVLSAEMQQLRQTMKAKDNQLKQLEQYAEDVASLQKELKDARQQLAQQREAHEEALEAVRSTPPIDTALAQEIARDDAEAAMMAAQQISTLEGLLRHQQERVEELKQALARQTEDALQQESFLQNEVARYSNAAVTAAESLQQLKQAYETEIELLKMDKEDTEKLLAAKDAEVADVRQDAEHNRIELSTTITAIKSVFNEAQPAPDLVENSLLARDLLQSVDHWKEQHLLQAKAELAEMQRKLQETGAALAAADSRPAALDTTSQELQELHAEQAEQVISTAHQLEVTRRKLEASKRQLASVRAARRLSRDVEEQIPTLTEDQSPTVAEAVGDHTSESFVPIIRAASESPELESMPASPGVVGGDDTQASVEAAESEESALEDINPTLLHPHWRSSVDLSQEEDASDPDEAGDDVESAASVAESITNNCNDDDSGKAAEPVVGSTNAGAPAPAIEEASLDDLDTSAISADEERSDDMPTRKSKSACDLFDEPPERTEVIASSTPVKKARPSIGSPPAMASVAADKLRELLAIKSEHVRLKLTVAQLRDEIEDSSKEQARLQAAALSPQAMTDDVGLDSGMTSLLQHVAQLQATVLPTLVDSSHLLLYTALQVGQLLKTVTQLERARQQGVLGLRLALIAALVVVVLLQAAYWPWWVACAAMTIAVVVGGVAAGVGALALGQPRKRVTVTMGWITRSSSLQTGAQGVKANAALRQAMLQASREDTRSINVSQKGHLEAPNDEIQSVLRKHLFSRLDHVFDQEEDAVLDLRTVGRARRHALLHLSTQAENKASSAGLAWGYLLNTAGLSSDATHQASVESLESDTPSVLGLLPCCTALASCQWNVFRTRRPHDYDFLHYKQLEVSYWAVPRDHSPYAIYHKGVQAVAQAVKSSFGTSRLGVVLNTAICGLDHPGQSVRLPLALKTGSNDHLWSTLKAAAANPLMADGCLALLQALNLQADVHITCLHPQPKPALADDTFNFAFLDSEAPLCITMYALGDRVTVSMGCSAHYREMLQPFFKKMQTLLA